MFHDRLINQYKMYCKIKYFLNNTVSKLTHFSTSAKFYGRVRSSYLKITVYEMNFEFLYTMIFFYNPPEFNLKSYEFSLCVVNNRKRKIIRERLFNLSKFSIHYTSFR